MIVELEQSATCESSQAKLLKEFTSNGPVVPRKELQEVFKSEPETDDTTVMRQAMSRAKKRLEKENLRIETCYRIVPEDTTDY
jgi:DNA-binding response OmpR family regulator